MLEARVRGALIRRNGAGDVEPDLRGGVVLPKPLGCVYPIASP